ncbi:cytochrome c biogenesis protein ResB [Kutzneria sp. NPDC052558]|uniref:cytochrome c biogenesis protein ResB n=1 Tax=Kutzneria sp. NPDC052558 TaxID=3364121 RepID=UPI0037C51681
MRTALILLALLALGALPGALLPQRQLNAGKVSDYITQHGWWGQLLDKLQFYDVYSSVWFSAIYVLLFISLVGCLTPRMFEYAKQSRQQPVITPRNLARLPHHASSTVDVPVDDVVEAAGKRLRGWRMVVRDEEDGARTISAERGYLRETGNLLFHFALLGLIVAIAFGKLFGYSGQVAVIADGSQFCNSGLFAYDSFTPGLKVDGTELDPFCIKVNSFKATYLADGQANSFDTDVQYQSGDALSSDQWQHYNLQSNHPLRIAGDSVYLLGHGYAPQFTVTFPNGQTRTKAIQWNPSDLTTMLSSGTTTFDPPDTTDETELRKHQIAITGLFAPTAVFDGTLMSSIFPAPNDPAVAVQVYVGDLGNNSGYAHNLFTIDQSMVDQGRLVQKAMRNLKLGQEITLDDGTRIRFDKALEFTGLQVTHDPSEGYVLVFAILLLVGLMGSLSIKRRRLWLRVTPSGDGTVVEVGGLARTDQAGYGEEFTRLSAGLLTGKDT